ncbi:MAG TPA: tRNA (N(6)-L-threonylcarbamoyladenosine(37)-C(2))-methylthiotransferase MtaB [Pseudobdellovibrionaceae bacterium]|nr:tRNA (N(6)-L-threonylcarbamoyladenosine(37)-C(2))-methylthiotransferase MtaB [Pseudobdellovibrionaceae bacterium]
MSQTPTLAPSSRPNIRPNARLNDIEIVLHTWGCKVNTYDSGLLEQRLQRQGASVKLGESTSATPQVGAARVHVLNTCAVTEEASREAARQVRRIKAREPFSRVVITGCGAQVDGGVFDALPGADLVIANSHKGDLEILIDRLFKDPGLPKVHRSNIFRKEELEEGGGLESDHTRAFLKIQDGCNSFCTYCVIPFARGKSRSIPIQRLVQRVNELEKMGAREVVLTGVHIGDYEDGERRLEDLVEAVLAHTKMPRLRLSSLEPVELSPRLIELYRTESRLCRHFHMSIQSACSATLARMRRQYDAAAVESALIEIQSNLPDAYVGMDVIAGFPGETEEEFQDTYDRLSKLPWTRLHVFPYSERPGTKALKLEGRVEIAVRQRRAAQLRELSRNRYWDMAQRLVDRELEVLTLREHEGVPQALSSNYWPIKLQRPQSSEIKLAPGRLVRAQVVRVLPPAAGRMDAVIWANVQPRSADDVEPTPSEVRL